MLHRLLKDTILPLCEDQTGGDGLVALFEFRVGDVHQVDFKVVDLLFFGFLVDACHTRTDRGLEQLCLVLIETVETANAFNGTSQGSIDIESTQPCEGLFVKSRCLVVGIDGNEGQSALGIGVMGDLARVTV